MSSTLSRVFAARLVGLPIFDPQGDQVGKVRDLVVSMRSEGTQPRVLGMVAEAEVGVFTLSTFDTDWILVKAAAADRAAEAWTAAGHTVTTPVEAGR